MFCNQNAKPFFGLVLKAKKIKSFLKQKNCFLKAKKKEEKDFYL
jgi:hypothetical protein